MKKEGSSAAGTMEGLWSALERFYSDLDGNVEHVSAWRTFALRCSSFAAMPRPMNFCVAGC